MRDVARDTLVKMAVALGPKYLAYIVKEMRDMLTKGYMVCRQPSLYCPHVASLRVTVVFLWPTVACLGLQPSPPAQGAAP